MNASEVIRIGRSRTRAARIAASTTERAAFVEQLRELDDQDRVLAGEAHQHHEPDLAEDVVHEAAQRGAPTSAPKTASGTTSITVNGRLQLS